MASKAKRVCGARSYNTDEVLRFVLSEEEFTDSDGENEGISSSEESEIDHELLQSCDRSR